MKTALAVWQGRSGRRILAKGPKVVLITEGPKGATAFTARRIGFSWRAEDHRRRYGGRGRYVQRGLPGGAGSGGAADQSAVASLSDDALRAALSLGTRAAAITCSRPGANPPWANEL